VAYLCAAWWAAAAAQHPCADAVAAADGATGDAADYRAYLFVTFFIGVDWIFVCFCFDWYLVPCVLCLLENGFFAARPRSKKAKAASIRISRDLFTNQIYLLHA